MEIPALLHSSPAGSAEQMNNTTFTTPDSLAGFLPELNDASSSLHDTELLLTNMLDMIDEQPSSPLDHSQVKHVLQKCLVTLSHYKLQNRILKFETTEQEQRNAIENDLIKSQVDFLLKSPFKPSMERDTTPYRQPIMNSTNWTPRALNNIHKSGVSKPKTMRLVEKLGKKDDQFGNCVKVFSLQKK